MCIKCLILIVCLFVCTSSELLGDKPMVIRYTKIDKLNIKLSLINIPTNVVEYYFKSCSFKDSKVVEKGKVDKTFIRIYLNASIERHQNYSLELLKDVGKLCSSRDILHLITEDINQTGSNKHKCLDQEKTCNIQVDFNNRCEYTNPVIVEVLAPTRYKYIKLNKSLDQTLFFIENEVFSVVCYHNEAIDTYNVTWKQYFPINNIVSVSEKLSGKTRCMLNIRLRWFDDGTIVYCTGLDGEISGRFTFKLNNTQTEIKGIEKINFNEQKPITHSCPKDQTLLRKTSFVSDFTRYTNSSTKVHKSDNGSTFFCMTYKKHGYTNEVTYYVSREIYNDVIYMYEDATTPMQDSWNIGIWLIPMIIAVVVIAGVIVLLRYKRRQIRDQPIQILEQNIYDSPTDVVYARIKALPCPTDKPKPTRGEEIYSTIIGVLEPDNLYMNTDASHNPYNVNMFPTTLCTDINAHAGTSEKPNTTQGEETYATIVPKSLRIQ